MIRATNVICILWITIFLSMYHAQPPLPEASVCDCECNTCNACDFENSCMVVTATGGDVIMGDLGVSCVIVESDVSNEILGTGNADCILVRGSSATVGSISTGNGDDCILVQDGAVSGGIFAGNDNDCVRVTQATAGGILVVGGDDDIIIEGSTLEETASETKRGMPMTTPSGIFGSGGNDCIKVYPYGGNPSFMGTINAGNEDDCIDVQTSSVLTISGSGGNDIIYTRCSLMNNIVGGNGDDVMIVEEVTIQPSSGFRNALNGGNGDDRILVESLTQNMGITNGRITGAGDTDSCCSRADPSVFEVVCEDETCPPVITTTCPRRLNDCIPFEVLVAP